MTSPPRALNDLSAGVREAIADTVVKREAELQRSLDLDVMTDRIRDLFEQRRAADMEWYFAAYELCREWSTLTLYPVRVIAAVVAVTSPQTSWTRNRQDAWTILQTNELYPDVPVPELASRILSAQAPDGGALATQPRHILEAALTTLRTGIAQLGNGPKVRSFYHNIRYCGDSRAVTIDTHMVRALLDDADMLSDSLEYRKTIGSRAPQRKADSYTDGLYPYLAEPIRRVAGECDYLPHQVQAAVWCAWRRGQGAWGGAVDGDPVYWSRSDIRESFDRAYAAF